MSTVTLPILTDATFAEKMDEQNALLAVLAEMKISETATLQDIHTIVARGLAPKLFSIGDQISVPWSDGTTDYTVPLDIVHFDNVTLRTGDIVPGMFVQWHYTTPFGMPFDANEAIFHADEALAPGQYYFTQVEAWGSKALKTAGQVWSFTTTIEVPAGGHICMTQGAVDTAEESIRIYTYASGSSTTALETLTPSHSNAGTNLGNWSNATKFSATGLNNMQRSNYGYNRWSQSCLRQWLNSAAAAGSWWSAQNVFDRVPTELASKRGFLAGFDDDFLAIVKPVKVRTFLNTVSDSEITPNYEDTFDTWFPASLEQEFVSPQVSGEGSYWEYWKQRVGHASPTAQYATEPERIRYAINATTSAQGCRLRSASRGGSGGTWYVYASGQVGSYGSAAHANPCAPACCIC